MEKTWNVPLVDAVHWLIETIDHSNEPDSGIALAQIALEMLSSLMLTPAEYSADKNAATRIEHILKKAKISPIVPPFLESLKKVADKEKIDGPELITRLRNGIIHPDRKKREKLEHWARDLDLNPVTLKNEACRLYAHYVQLLLLHKMNFKGVYANRTRKRGLGEVENVPWV